MIVCLQTWSLRMRIATFRLHNAGLLQAMRSIECTSPIYCCARLWLDGIPCLESDLNFVQGSFKEHFRRKKKTQKHNAKIGLSFERFQKWWFCKWWSYWKAMVNCMEAVLEGSRRIIPSCPTGGSQCATYTADWLALLTTKWLSVPGSEKTSMNVLTIRLVLLMYFLPTPKRRGRLSEARFAFIPS